MTILGIPDGLDLRAEHPDAVACEHAAVVKRKPAVERSLTAKAKHDRVDTFLDDDRFD